MAFVTFVLSFHDSERCSKLVSVNSVLVEGRRRVLHSYHAALTSGHLYKAHMSAIIQ